MEKIPAVGTKRQPGLEHRRSKARCRASCSMRDWLPDCSPVTCPKAPLPNCWFGFARLAWLKTLRASARNCSVLDSTILKSFRREASVVASAGPRPKVRGALPKVKGAFCAKAEVLNHSAVLAAREREPPRLLGLPTRLGRKPS